MVGGNIGSGGRVCGLSRCDQIDQTQRARVTTVIPEYRASSYTSLLSKHDMNGRNIPPSSQIPHNPAPAAQIFAKTDKWRLPRTSLHTAALLALQSTYDFDASSISVVHMAKFEYQVCHNSGPFVEIRPKLRWSVNGQSSRSNPTLSMPPHQWPNKIAYVNSYAATDTS